MKLDETDERILKNLMVDARLSARQLALKLGMSTVTILSRIRSMNRQNAIINTIMVGLPGASTNKYGNVVFDERARPKELYDFLHTLAEENGGVYVGR